MSRISFAAWHGSHYIGLAELLCALGRVTADMVWEVRLDEMAPGPEGAAIESLARRPTVGTRDLILAAFPDGQIIDGELRGYVNPGLTEPSIVLRAVDSSEWDIECADEKVLTAIRAIYPDSFDVS